MPGAGPRADRIADDERFSRLLEALPAAVVLSTHAGKIRLLNLVAATMFGYVPAELTGQPLDVLLSERCRREHVDLPAVTFGLRRDGTEFPLHISCGAIEFDGETMAVSVIADTGPQRKIEAERVQARRELHRSDADLEEFAYAASHDLKAPLRAIAHLAEWVREDIEPIAGAETMDNLTLLQGRVTRLQMLLDGLLAYSRLGHANSDVEDVDIGELVREVSGMLDVPAGFEIVCEGEMPVIRTRRIPIQMVLRNLISNALQHHDRGEGRITVAMRVGDGLAEFRVSDDGPGIAKQFHHRIFVIFETLTSRDDKESTGIGLAIVKKQVESNGGLVRVESDPAARGCTFIFTWTLG